MFYGVEDRVVCCKEAKYPWKMLLGILVCLYANFVYSHPLVSEPPHSLYGSCQKPTISEQDLELNIFSGSCSAVHATPVAQEPALFIFVSNSMPERSLKQWGEQSEKAGGTLVFRGFMEDSPKKMLERVMELFGDNTNGVTIDPERFAQFNIYQAPAVMILLPSNNILPEENQKPTVEIVYGDVPLEEALRVLKDRGNKEIREASDYFLARLRDKLQ